jgi:hypothetical protein
MKKGLLQLVFGDKLEAMHTEDPILDVDRSWRRGDEFMGSKRKFWFWYQDAMWLFKQARPNTGEHWAEKVASEIAGLVRLPTHEVVLATFEGRPGCAVKSFLNPYEVLVHGNELLAGVIKGYDKDKQRGQADHNFQNIVTTLESLFPGEKARESASLRMVGYLVFDALVGNTDRHHENWGVVLKLLREPQRKGVAPGPPALQVALAPTFDHGSSLGRELLEDRARQFASEPAGIRHYIRKGKGGIFRDTDAAKGLSPMALVELIAINYPDLFKPWRERIGVLPEDFARPLLESIPSSCMCGASRDFVLAFLRETRKLILSIQ